MIVDEGAAAELLDAARAGDEDAARLAEGLRDLAGTTWRDALNAAAYLAGTLDVFPSPDLLACVRMLLLVAERRMLTELREHVVAGRLSPSAIGG